MLGRANDSETEKSVISSDMKIKGKISAEGEPGFIRISSRRYKM